ncbi:MAG: hypothetical protein ACFCAD_08375 [Pleurocapsa sp.]
MSKSEGLTFEDLKHNYHKISWGFEEHRARLESSNPRLLHWIGSIDYDGYVREKSLSYLIDNYQPGDENRILLRLEDWVLNIRNIAFEWTKNNFHRLSIKQIDNNYRLVLYLAIKQRPYIFSAVKTIELSLIEKLEKISLKEFKSLHSNFRSYLYNLALPKNKNIRSFLIQDKDPINRLLLLKLFDYSELTQEEASFLKQDSCVLVKKQFIYYRLRQNVKIEQAELTELALDKNKSVRELAGYYLTKYYGVNLYELYKSKTNYQFYYIADFAKREDLRYFLEGMTSNKRIRLLCFKAICHIKPELARQFDLKKLILENNQFRQLIKKRILPTLSLTEFQEFRSVLFLEPYGKVIYLSLLYKKSYWHFIEESLDLIIDYPTSEIINLFCRLYGQKINIYRPVSNEQKQAIIAKIEHLAIRSASGDRLSYLIPKLKFAIKNA